MRHFGIGIINVRVGRADLNDCLINHPLLRVLLMFMFSANCLCMRQACAINYFHISSVWILLSGTHWTVIYVALIKITHFPLFAASVEMGAVSDVHAAIPHELGQIGCTPMNYLPPLHLLSANRVSFSPPSVEICLALIWLCIYSLVRAGMNFGRPLT